MSNSSSHRQLLIRCEVTNRNNDASVRFVEHSVYRLWQYMMANKHDIVVNKAAICLWLPDAEWATQSDLFRHAGDTHQVHRISFALYDKDSGLCNTLQRFVPSADSQRVKQLLLRRVPEEVRESGDFAMELDSGHAIVREGLVDLVNLGYALTDSHLTPTQALTPD